MTLKLKFLRSLTRLFIMLVSLTMSLFSEKCLLPIDAFVIWCPTWSKNLGRSLAKKIVADEWHSIIQSSFFILTTQLPWIHTRRKYLKANLWFIWEINKFSKRFMLYNEILFVELGWKLKHSHTGLISSDSFQTRTLTACITLKNQPLWLWKLIQGVPH
jgi:hypothetical protein